MGGTCLNKHVDYVEIHYLPKSFGDYCSIFGHLSHFALYKVLQGTGQILDALILDA